MSDVFAAPMRMLCVKVLFFLLKCKRAHFGSVPFCYSKDAMKKEVSCPKKTEPKSSVLLSVL